MKYFSKNKFWSVNTNYKNLPCLDKIKTKKAFFDLSHVKALVTDFKNTTIKESMKNQVSGQNLVCRHESFSYFTIKRPVCSAEDGRFNHFIRTESDRGRFSQPLLLRKRFSRPLILGSYAALSKFYIGRKTFFLLRTIILSAN